MRIWQSKLECLFPAFSHWALRSPYYNQRSKTKFNSYSCTSKQNQTPHVLKFWITNWQKLLVKAIKHFNFLRMLWKKKYYSVYPWQALAAFQAIGFLYYLSMTRIVLYSWCASKQRKWTNTFLKSWFTNWQRLAAKVVKNFSLAKMIWKNKLECLYLEALFA
jgi:hypothetical protein